jgi:hypothetical protein
LVRVNNDRVEQAYDLKRLKSRLEQAEDLRSKLEVERNNLTVASSPGQSG